MIYLLTLINNFRKKSIQEYIIDDYYYKNILKYFYEIKYFILIRYCMIKGKTIIFNFSCHLTLLHDIRKEI